MDQLGERGNTVNAQCTWTCCGKSGGGAVGRKLEEGGPVGRSGPLHSRCMHSARGRAAGNAAVDE